MQALHLQRAEQRLAASVSQQLPGRLMEAVMPCALRASLKSPLAYWWAYSTGRCNTLKSRSCNWNIKTWSLPTWGASGGGFGWATWCWSEGSSAAALGGDCSRSAKRESGRGRRRVPSGRGALVSAKGWHAQCQPCPTFHSLSVLSRARGYRSSARAGSRHSGDRQADRARCFDDLTRAAPQCRQPGRLRGLSGLDS